MTKINVQNTEITIVSHNDDDYISLTDMARSQLQEHIIFRWLSLKSTIEYLGEWEMLYNPNFNCTEFGTFRNMAGSNNFVLSVKTWIEKTNAIGIFSKDYATINELICLSNMENINAVLINDGVPQGERLIKLNQIAIQQMQVLEDNESRKLLK
jgi:hypothetical protein